jgi:hypothetical protein
LRLANDSVQRIAKSGKVFGQKKAAFYFFMLLPVIKNKSNANFPPTLLVKLLI